ncbi:hypothetical protein F4818DRAFT_440885 [Hypoxylon cercidicola]|nr:hypothetical protein F4818DRAFT_440885 [Hypoxylon cercidicola]
MLIIESTTSVTEELHAAPSIEVQEPEEVEDEAPKWKGKGKAGVASEEDRARSGDLHSSELTVDWTKFEPPAGLRDTADSKSELVAQIIQESIDKVKARIAEEEKRKAEDEAERLTQEEKLRQESEKGKSIEVLDTPLGEKTSEDDRLSKTRAETPAMTASKEPHVLLAPEPPAKSKKRSLMRLFRRLNHTEKGESSSTGAARHRLDVVRSSMESSTYVATKLLVSEVLKTASHNNSSPSSSVHEPEVECVSCLDDFSPKEMVKAPCHSYCKPCFLRLINTVCENEQQWPPKCCLNPIPRKTIISNIDDDLTNVYRDRAEEWDLPVSERIYCSNPICSVWVKPRYVDRAHGVARCSEGHQTCTICRGPQHEGDNCPQDRDMMRTDELAEEEGWKRCYGCHAYVEHREACQHMTCRCGAEFCYVCGARWRTCGCNMEQLASLKNSVATRRQARLDRELQEAAEIEEALRQVEEFEREEALKAELLRQEQERLAEERRQRELEERIKREEERRQAVQAKFQELRDIFTHVHELQRIIVQREHKTEETSLESDSAAALADLRERLGIDREKLSSATKVKFAKREYALNCEFEARVAEERRIEEQYHDKLKAYWSHRQAGEAKVEASMRELKRKMDDGYRSWEEWRNKQLSDYLWSIKEEQAIKEELMQEMDRRLTESTREEQIAFSLRKVAELRWVDEVIEERGRMLADMETTVIENGEDIDAWFADESLDDDNSTGTVVT